MLYHSDKVNEYDYLKHLYTQFKRTDFVSVADKSKHNEIVLDLDQGLPRSQLNCSPNAPLPFLFRMIICESSSPFNRAVQRIGDVKDRTWYRMYSASVKGNEGEPVQFSVYVKQTLRIKISESYMKDLGDVTAEETAAEEAKAEE